MKIILAVLLILNVALLLWGMGQREFMKDEYSPGATYHPELMNLLPPEKPQPVLEVKVETGKSVAVTTIANTAAGADGMATVVVNAGGVSTSEVQEPQAGQQGPAEIKEAAAGQCMYIGPYKTAISRGRAGRQLQDMQIEFRESSEQKGRVLGYRVYQGPFKSNSATLSARRALEKQGVKDMYLMKEGQEQFISLGFFSSQESADEFIRIFSNKKIKTKERTEYEPYYWLIVSDLDSIKQLQLKNAMPLPEGITKNIRDCGPGNASN